MPLTLTGTALKRNPSVGSAERLVRCSQIGTGVQQGGVHGTGAAVGVVDVQRVDPDEQRALLEEVLGCVGCQEGVADTVGIGSPVAIPHGVDQHCLPGEAVRQQVSAIDCTAHGARHVDRHRVEIGKSVE
jgi:hypothetical protein